MKKENVTMADLIEFVRSLDGLSFVGLRMYANKQNEVANHTINVGGDYGKMKTDDHNTLLSVTADRLLMWSAELNLPFEIVEEAYNELVNSFAPPKPDAPVNKRSEGQKKAYINLGNGLRLHINSGKLHIWGQTIAKKVIQNGEYKEVNSEPLTIAKNKIRKSLNLKTAKFRNYVVGNVSTFRFGGKALNIHP